jgi:hypothetical protein
MKAAFLAALSLAISIAARAEDTAYTALRVVGRSQGQEALNHVLELRGRSGSPQPAVWKIVLDEPRARGGVREVEVQRGKIVSERTPAAARVSGSVMNFGQLNLDSDGAFTIANQEAQKAALPFDHVDYFLRSGTDGGAPVWLLEMSDGRTGHVAAIELAADSGAVLRKDFSAPVRRPDNDRAYLDDRRPLPPPPPAPSDEGWSRPGEPFRSPADFFHRLGKRFEKRSNQLENFFTGKGAREDRQRYPDSYRDDR